MSDGKNPSIRRSPRLQSSAAVVAALFVLLLPATDASAKALASASLDIVKLVWRQQVGAARDTANDPVLKMVVGGIGSTITVNQTTFNTTASYDFSINGVSQPASEQTRAFVDTVNPLDLAPQCIGAGCPPQANGVPYANNDFSSIPSLTTFTQSYLYADEYLKNSTLGFEIQNGALSTPGGAVIGLRADAGLVGVGSADAAASLDLPNLATVSAPGATSNARRITYFELVYSSSTVGLTGPEAVAVTASEIALTISVRQVYTWDVELEPFATNATLYSPDFVFKDANTHSVFLQGIAHVGVDQTAIPAPGALWLVLGGLPMLGGRRLRRRAAGVGRRARAVARAWAAGECR